MVVVNEETAKHLHEIGDRGVADGVELSPVNKILENTQATLLKHLLEVITDGSIEKRNAEEDEQETKRSQFSQLQQYKIHLLLSTRTTDLLSIFT